MLAIRNMMTLYQFRSVVEVNTLIRAHYQNTRTHQTPKHFVAKHFHVNMKSADANVK